MQLEGQGAYPTRLLQNLCKIRSHKFSSFESIWGLTLRPTSHLEKFQMSI